MVAYFMDQFRELLKEMLRSLSGVPAKARRAAMREELRRLDLFADEEIEGILDELDRLGELREPLESR